MCGSMEKNILQLLTSHGTLVTPEVMEYISTKPDPENYIKTTMKTLAEAPLYLTIDILKSAESSHSTILDTETSLDHDSASETVLASVGPTFR